MAGFKLEIKGKTIRKGAPKSGVSIPVTLGSISGVKLGQNPIKKRPFTGLDDESDDDEGQQIEITSFGNKGAVAKTSISKTGSSGSKGPLVIKMAKPGRRFGTDEDDQARQTLLGKDVPDENGLTIDIANKRSGVKFGTKNNANKSMEDKEGFDQQSDEESDENAADSYDSVPVEMFGAALLRGMGWKPLAGLAGSLEAQNAAKEVKHRQKGVVLGIGAQAVEDDLMKDLMGLGKVTVPLKRKKVER